MISISVLLVTDYSWLACSLLTEPWRVANRLAANQSQSCPVVQWRFCSWGAEQVTASNGLLIPIEYSAEEAFIKPDIVVVLAGHGEQENIPGDCLAWLRKMDIHGALIAGVDTGPIILAAAGLLSSHQLALHHEAIPAFKERHLKQSLSYSLYNIDGRRATCAGGVATLDFSLSLISRLIGPSLAQSTANALIYSRRESTETDGMIDSAGKGWLDPRVSKAIQYLTSSDLGRVSVKSAAEHVGISERQLLRVFEKQLGLSPRAYITQIRLNRAKVMLSETNLSVAAIALAVGYASGSELGRAWRKKYCCSPSSFREAL